MKLMYSMMVGGLSLALLGGMAEPVYAKPERYERHEAESFLPHQRIKRHIEHKHDKIRRFHHGKQNAYSERRWVEPEPHRHEKHRKKKGKRKKHKHDRYNYDQRSHRHYHHNDPYYSGWHYHRHYRYGHRHYGRDDRYYYKRYPYPRYYSGFWHEHRRHGYRHRRHNGYHYYFDRTGFYFPGLGLIKHGHKHGRHCPDWHYEPFAAGVVLNAILSD